jgi:hypothetical protein
MVIKRVIFIPSNFRWPPWHRLAQGDFHTLHSAREKINRNSKKC